MKLTTRQRIELAKKAIKGSPLTPEERIIRPRLPYQRGVKTYLSEFKVGETRELQENLKWDSLRSVATWMKRNFGCAFTFSRRDEKKYITRLK